MYFQNTREIHFRTHWENAEEPLQPMTFTYSVLPFLLLISNKGRAIFRPNLLPFTVHSTSNFQRHFLSDIHVVHQVPKHKLLCLKKR